MQQDYTYAVARIRYRETQLLSDTDLQQLLSAKDTETVLRTLRDKGWGNSAQSDSPDELLRFEDTKTWAFVAEIVQDQKALDFLLIPNDYHNLKVAVKAITRDVKPDDMLIHHAAFDADTLYKAVSQREYTILPEYLQTIVQDAMTALLQTSDGQLCDILIDRACLDTVYQIGSASEEEIIRRYCEMYVAAADIKIAVRCAKTGKGVDLIRRAIAPCDSLDAEKLAVAASLGYDDIMEYLRSTAYRSAVPTLSRSMSAFEKWCDDTLTEALKTQKWEPFGIGPVIAYILARQNEIKAVQMILSAKVNGLPEDLIKERLRMMYA